MPVLKECRETSLCQCKNLDFYCLNAPAQRAPALILELSIRSIMKITIVKALDLFYYFKLKVVLEGYHRYFFRSQS